MEIRPLDILIQQFWRMKNQISPSELGKIENSTLAKKVVSDCVDILKAIENGEQFYRYDDIAYSLPQTLPDKILRVIVPMYLDGKERKDYLDDFKKRGIVVLEGHRFNHEPKREDERQRLELEVENYLVGENIVWYTNHAPKFQAEKMVRRHSAGDSLEDQYFFEDLLCTSMGVEQISGRDKIKLIVSLLKQAGMRSPEDSQIKPQYDRLMQIYAEQDRQEK
jgi:hypothetical protein